MKTRTFVLTLAVAPCLVVACQSNDSRCNATNCQALVNCNATLRGEEIEVCASAAAAANLDVAGLVNQSCIDACNTNGNGALVQCVAQNFPQQSCHDIGLDGGDAFTAIEAVCGISTDAGCNTTACINCQDQCSTTFTACLNACVDAGGVFDAGACFPCADTCSQQNIQCDSKCVGS